MNNKAQESAEEELSQQAAELIEAHHQTREAVNQLLMRGSVAFNVAAGSQETSGHNASSLYHRQRQSLVSAASHQQQQQQKEKRRQR